MDDTRPLDPAAAGPPGWTVTLLAVLLVAIGGCGPNSTAPSPCLGCPVELATMPRPPGPNNGCILMEVGGTLVPHPIFGLGLLRDGNLRGVRWPFGWTARREAEGIVLINRAGDIVAREGGRISMEGGSTSDYDFLCDPEFWLPD
jgi:hypothetical protein